MTAISLNVRGPVIVLVGSFNPAIFTPVWLAQYAYGYPDEAEIEAYEAVLNVGGGSVLVLTFIEGVAVHVTPDRLEIFVINPEAGTLATAEKVLGKALEALPHTPLRAMGCNFRFEDADPEPGVVDLFDSPEGLEGKFAVNMRQVSAQIDLDDAKLNFVRAAKGDEVHFNFNFHRDVVDTEACLSLLDGLIERELARGKQIMGDIYGYDEYVAAGYNFDHDLGEPADAAEATD